MSVHADMPRVSELRKQVVVVEKGGVYTDTCLYSHPGYEGIVALKSDGTGTADSVTRMQGGSRPHEEARHT